MFSNDRKTVGLFISNTVSDFQADVCHALAKYTQEKGYNLAVICNYGNFGSNKNYYEGDMDIFKLPPYEEFDGVILAFDTMNNENSKKLILNEVKKRCDCPIVALRERVKGADNFLVDNEEAMEELICHMIDVHGKKDIAFMTGRMDNNDAVERLNVFSRVMKSRNLPVSDNQIMYGDFWRMKGREACDKFQKEDGTFPEAIVCANDYMAIAVIDELSKRGVRVPDEVLLSGYDGITEALNFNPSITTSSLDFGEMCKQVMDLIDRKQPENPNRDMTPPCDHKLPGKMILGGSCGCKEAEYELRLSRQSENNAMNYRVGLRETLISFMSVSFNEVDELEKMHEVINDNIGLYPAIKDYYICLNEGLLERDEPYNDFTDTMIAVVAIRDGKDMGEVSIPFPKKELIPKEMVQDEPQCFFFVPLHFQNHLYGYEAYSYNSPEKSGEMYLRWSIAVSNAIQNILTHSKLRYMVQELGNMYVHDVLTGLYNRRGFETYAKSQFLESKATESMYCVIAIDMDNLKSINDIFGHHEGDAALKAIGGAIEAVHFKGQISARIGGDEFEVTFRCHREEDVENWVKLFYQNLEEYNENAKKSYVVHASLGFKAAIPGPGDTLESFMKVGDDRMYQNKIKNKMERKEEIRTTSM